MISSIEEDKVTFDFSVFVDSEFLADEFESPVVEEFQDFSISTLA